MVGLLPIERVQRRDTFRPSLIEVTTPSPGALSEETSPPASVPVSRRFMPLSRCHREASLDVAKRKILCSIGSQSLRGRHCAGMAPDATGRFGDRGYR
jgi:hypothetical protein